MNSKRALLLVLLLLSLVFVACGGGDAEPAAVAPAAEADTAAEPVDVAALPEQIDVEMVHRIKDQADVFVIDVREQFEYDEWHIAGVTLMPTSEFDKYIDQLPRDKEIIVTCNSGNRSGQVTRFLIEQGYTNVHDMAGGIKAWDAAGYETE